MDQPNQSGPDYYYPWLLTVTYDDGSEGRHEFRDDDMLKRFLADWVSWDAVRGALVQYQPMIPGKQYKVDVRYQS